MLLRGEIFKCFLKFMHYIQASYKGHYEQSKDKNLYKVTDTDQYKSIAEGQKALSDVSYVNITHL